MPDSRTSRYPVEGCPLVPSVLADWFQVPIRKPVSVTQLFPSFDLLDDSCWFALEESEVFNLADQVQGRAQRQVYSDLPESCMHRPVILGQAPKHLHGLPWSTRARKWLIAVGAWEDPEKLSKINLGELFTQKGLGLSSVLEILVILEGLCGRKGAAAGADADADVDVADEAGMAAAAPEPEFTVPLATIAVRATRSPLEDRPLFPTCLKPALDKVPGGIPQIVYHSSCWQTLSPELCQRIHVQAVQWLTENDDSLETAELPTWPTLGKVEFNRRTVTALQNSSRLEGLQSGEPFTIRDLDRIQDLGMRGIVDMLSELEWIEAGCRDSQDNPISSSRPESDPDKAPMPSVEQVWEGRALGQAVALDDRDRQLMTQAFNLPDLEALGPWDPRFGAAFRIATRDCCDLREFLQRASQGDSVFASEVAWQEQGRHMLRDVIDSFDLTPADEMTAMITAALPRPRPRAVVLGYFGLTGEGPLRMAQLAERDDTTVQYISGILDRASHEISEAQPAFLPALSRLGEIQIPAQGMPAADLSGELAEKGISVSAEFLLALPDMGTRLGVKSELHILDKHAGLLSAGNGGAEHSRQMRLAIARVLRRHGVVSRQDLQVELGNLGIAKDQISVQDIARGMNTLGESGAWVYNDEWSSKRLDTRFQRIAAVAESVPIDLLHGQIARDLQLRQMLPPALILAQYAAARGFGCLEEDGQGFRFTEGLASLDVLSPSEKVLVEILQKRDGIASRSDVQQEWEKAEMGWALLNNLGSYSALIAHVPGGFWALVGTAEAAKTAVFRAAVVKPEEPVAEIPEPVAPPKQVVQPAAEVVEAAPSASEISTQVVEPARQTETLGFATKPEALPVSVNLAHAAAGPVVGMRWHERGDLAIVLETTPEFLSQPTLELPADVMPHFKNARMLLPPSGEGATIRLRKGVMDLKACLTSCNLSDGDLVVLQLWPQQRAWKCMVVGALAEFSNV